MFVAMTEAPEEAQCLQYSPPTPARRRARPITPTAGSKLSRISSMARWSIVTRKVGELGGQPIREPIVWYGPFVMNTKQEILDTIDLYERGELGSIPARQ